MPPDFILVCASEAPILVPVRTTGIWELWWTLVTNQRGEELLNHQGPQGGGAFLSECPALGFSRLLCGGPVFPWGVLFRTPRYSVASHCRVNLHDRLTFPGSGPA